MRFTHASRDRLLVADCEPELAEQAKMLLELAAEADQKADGLRNGSVIEFGWAPLKLRAEGADLIICEPDYEHDVNLFIPSVKLTLKVLLDQALVLKALGVSGVAAKYNHAVVLKRGVLQMNHRYLYRRAPTSRDDSGWYVGPRDDLMPADESDLEALYVYQFVNLAPALMKVMALPYEYLIVFRNDEIETVLNDRGKALSISSINV